MKRISLACVLITLCVSTPLWAVEDVDATLQKFFPDRDLTKAAVKIVDHANGFYIVADTVDILKDGRIRTTNTVVLQRLGKPNEATGFVSYEGPRMILMFDKSIETIADLKRNTLKVISPCGDCEPNNRQ